MSIGQIGKLYVGNHVRIANTRGQATMEAVEVHNQDGTLAGILNLHTIRDADGKPTKMIAEMKNAQAQIMATLEAEYV